MQSHLRVWVYSVALLSLTGLSFAQVAARQIDNSNPADSAKEKPSVPPVVASPSNEHVQTVKSAPVGFILEEGTPVRMRLTRNLSSADEHKGDQVDFETLDDVAVDGVIVVPRGSVAMATITEAEHKKSMGRGGKLNVNIDTVRLRDGQRIALRAIKEGKGGGHVGAMTGAMVATGIVFFPAAPLFLFIHGKDMNIPKGTEITAYVNGNTPLERSKFENKVASAESTPSTVAGAGTTSVNISSTPAGADVEIDGSFSGNSPSALNLASGEHMFKVSKTGFKTWERKVKLSGGTINLIAELQPEK